MTTFWRSLGPTFAARLSLVTFAAAIIGILASAGMASAQQRVVLPGALEQRYPIHLTSGHDVWAAYYYSTVSFHVWAYAGDDRVRTAYGADYLEGMMGADILEGMGGNDILVGGIGPDLLIGGLGYDTCVGNSGLDQFLGCEAVTQ
jgi:hypothetical protein